MRATRIQFSAFCSTKLFDKYGCFPRYNGSIYIYIYIYIYICLYQRYISIKTEQQHKIIISIISNNITLDILNKPPKVTITGKTQTVACGGRSFPLSMQRLRVNTSVLVYYISRYIKILFII